MNRIYIPRIYILIIYAQIFYVKYINIINVHYIMYGFKFEGNNNKIWLYIRCRDTTIVITKALLILVLYVSNSPTFDKFPFACFIITTL